MACVLWSRELVRKRWREQARGVVGVPVWRGLARICCKGLGNNFGPYARCLETMYSLEAVVPLRNGPAVHTS